VIFLGSLLPALAPAAEPPAERPPDGGGILEPAESDQPRDRSWVARRLAQRRADGSVAWYFHLKNGSVTTKAIGQPIAAGEKLGAVASSGCSSGPHLHFEVHQSGGALIDRPASPTS